MPCGAKVGSAFQAEPETAILTISACLYGIIEEIKDFSIADKRIMR